MYKYIHNCKTRYHATWNSDKHFFRKQWVALKNAGVLDSRLVCMGRSGVYAMLGVSVSYRVLRSVLAPGCHAASIWACWISNKHSRLTTPAVYAT